MFLINAARKSALLGIVAVAVLLANLIWAKPAGATPRPVPSEAISTSISRPDLNLIPSASSAQQTATPPFLPIAPEVEKEYPRGDLSIKPDHPSSEKSEGSINGSVGANALFRLELSEALLTADSLARAFAKSLAESPRGGDTLSRGAVFSRSLGEGIKALDTIQKNPQKKIFESYATADSLARAFAKSLAESPRGGDALGRGAGFSRSLGEGIKALDTIQKNPQKKIFESYAISDIFAKSTSFSRSLGEGIRALEAIQKNLRKGILESCATADSLAKTFARPLVEFPKVVDTWDRSTSFSRSWGEGIRASEAIQKNLRKGILEPCATADSLTRAFAKPLAESPRAVDTLGRGTLFSRSLGEKTIASEAIQRNSRKGILEPCIVTDTLARAFAKPLEESSRTADALLLRVIFVRGFTADLSMRDNIQKKSLKALGETWRCNESIAKTTQRTLELERINGTDAIAKGVNKVLDTEQSSVKDSPSIKGVYSRSFAEQAALQETFDILYRIRFAEPLTLGESRALLFSKTLAEKPGIAESFNQRASYVRSLTEVPLNINDGYRVVRILLLAELPLKTKDSLASKAQYLRSSNEGLVSEDSLSKFLLIPLLEEWRNSDSEANKVAKELSEAPRMAEFFAPRTEYRRSPGEALVSRDSISKSLLMLLLEDWGNSDSEASEIAKELSEAPRVDEKFARVASYVLSFAEGCRWESTWGMTNLWKELSEFLQTWDELSQIASFFISLDNEEMGAADNIPGTTIDKLLSEEWNAQSIVEPFAPRVWIGDFVVILGFVLLFVAIFRASRRRKPK